MQMRLKLAQGVQPTREQALEIAQVVMSEPDMGWGVGARFEPLAEEGKHTYEERCAADEGVYLYRVNLKEELITVLKIED